MVSHRHLRTNGGEAVVAGVGRVPLRAATRRRPGHRASHPVRCSSPRARKKRSRSEARNLIKQPHVLITADLADLTVAAPYGAHPQLLPSRAQRRRNVGCTRAVVAPRARPASLLSSRRAITTVAEKRPTNPIVSPCGQGTVSGLEGGTWCTRFDLPRAHHPRTTPPRHGALRQTGPTWTRDVPASFRLENMPGSRHPPSPYHSALSRRGSSTAECSSFRIAPRPFARPSQAPGSPDPSGGPVIARAGRCMFSSPTRSRTGSFPDSVELQATRPGTVGPTSNPWMSAHCTVLRRHLPIMREYQRANLDCRIRAGALLTITRRRRDRSRRRARWAKEGEEQLPPRNRGQPQGGAGWRTNGRSSGRDSLTRSLDLMRSSRGYGVSRNKSHAARVCVLPTSPRSMKAHHLSWRSSMRGEPLCTAVDGDTCQGVVWAFSRSDARARRLRAGRPLSDPASESALASCSTRKHHSATGWAP